jgi:hypothetical protein
MSETTSETASETASEPLQFSRVLRKTIDETEGGYKWASHCILLQADAESFVLEQNSAPSRGWNRSTYECKPVEVQEVGGDGAWVYVDGNDKPVLVQGKALKRLQHETVADVKRIMGSKYIQLAEITLPPRGNRVPTVPRIMGRACCEQLSDDQFDYCRLFPKEFVTALLAKDQSAYKAESDAQNAKSAVACAIMALDVARKDAAKMIATAEENLDMARAQEKKAASKRSSSSGDNVLAGKMFKAVTKFDSYS